MWTTLANFFYSIIFLYSPNSTVNRIHLTEETQKEVLAIKPKFDCLLLKEEEEDIVCEEPKQKHTSLPKNKNRLKKGKKCFHSINLAILVSFC